MTPLGDRGTRFGTRWGENSENKLRKSTRYLYGLENKVKSIFSDTISGFNRDFNSFPKEDAETYKLLLYKLHFYYGIKSYRVSIDREYDAAELKTVKFDSESKFKDFTLNEIIKMGDSCKIIKQFDFSVDSLQSSMVTFEFFSCVKKLLNMRNKLAHEVREPKFKDADCIELLSDDLISEELESKGMAQATQMADSTKQIASNLVYMDLIINKLNEIKD